MGKAKGIYLKFISPKVANLFIKKWHYSGKVVNNSKLHFGVFLDNSLHGVMSYGSPLDKRKVLKLVQPSLWNEMLELNRMAFDPWLPRNSESRALGVSFKIIKNKYPHIKWILSFADGTQCGDGTIYRASGFKLTSVRKNYNTVKFGSKVIHKMTLESNPTRKRDELGGKSYYDLTGGKYDFKKYCDYVGGKILKGYQLRYIKILSKNCKLMVPEIPFSKINEIGAGMYKGNKRLPNQTDSIDLIEKGGVEPTQTLQL